MNASSVPSVRFVHIVASTLFAVYILIGFSVYRDFGVPIDEYSQIELGRVNYNRVVYGSRELSANFDRYYGPVFEVVLHVTSPVLESVLHVDLESSRHLEVFVFFAVSLVFFYLLLADVFGHPVYGLLGTIFLVTSPRIFAESFYNTKDIPFLGMVIIILYLCKRALHPRMGSVVLIAVASGIANAIRPQGLFVTGCVAVGLFVGTRVSLRQKFIKIILYVILTLLVTFILFPVFWDGGLSALVGYWQRSASPVGVPTFYFGRFYTSPNIPWHYLPVLIGITSPLSIILLSLIGSVLVIQGIRRTKRKIVPNDVLLTVMALIAFGSIIAAIVFHARTYDGWRHLYYIYPSMIGMSILVLKKLYRLATDTKGILSIAAATCMLLVSVDTAANVQFMIRNHPYEYVYFNPLVVSYEKARKLFDFDYWGISYKQLFKHLQHIPPGNIYIAEQFPYTENVMIPALRKRGFVMVPTPAQADIAVIINRYDKKIPGAGWEKIYAVSVEGADISAIYARDSYVNARKSQL